MQRLFSIVLGISAVALAAVDPRYTNITYEIKRPVPQKTLDFLASLQKAAPRQDIRDLISVISQQWAETHATQLSGESSTQITRVSTSVNNANGINQAVNYVRSQCQSYGFEVELHNYRAGWGPNVICTLRGVSIPAEIVIIGAHLDGIPATGRAPAANDDGSGSAVALAIAQAIFTQQARFARTVVIEWYTGEEQGLVGSRALAALRAQRNDNVVAMLQGDMVALHLAQDPIGIAFVQDPRAADPTLTATVLRLTQEYRDLRLTVYQRVLSGSSCCSDHQSYFEQGYPSVGLIEPRGYTGDPQYHRAGDLVRRANYDTLQTALVARTTLAAAATFAELQ